MRVPTRFWRRTSCSRWRRLTSARTSSAIGRASAQLTFVRSSAQGGCGAEGASAYQTRANSVDLTLQTKGLLDQGVAVKPASSNFACSRRRWTTKFTRDHPATRR